MSNDNTAQPLSWGHSLAQSLSLNQGHLRTSDTDRIDAKLGNPPLEEDVRMLEYGTGIRSDPFWQSPAGCEPWTPAVVDFCE